MYKNNLKYPIIGISGIKNSGKEELTKMLQTAYINIKYGSDYHYKNDYEYIKNVTKNILEIKHFATPLKQVASILLSVDIEVFNDRKTKEQYRSNLLELSDILKANDDERFRRVTRHEINTNNKTTFILEDLRLEPEEKLIREMGGFIIGIERPNNENNINHETETTYYKIKKDIIVENDGTLDDLYNKAYKIVEEMFVR